MEDLITALQIFLKYTNGDRSPTHCEHDVMMIGCGIELEDVSKQDIKKLDELGFFWDTEYDSFISFRYGSC